MSTIGGRRRGLGLAWLLALCFMTLGPALGTASRLTYHEAFVAQGAREILASGRWEHPTIGGRPWLEKPPLPFWMVAAAGSIAGRVTPLAARLPSALAAAFLVLGVAHLARRHYGTSVALLAGAMQATTSWTVLRGRLAEADVSLACLIVWTLVAFDHLRTPTETNPRPWRWVFFVLLGLTSLVKGTGFGAALVVSVVLVVLAWDRRPEAVRRLIFPAGWVVSGLIAVVWPLAMVAKYGRGVGSLWLMHVADRVGDRSGHGFFAGESWGEYLLGVLGQGLPWTPLALIGIVHAFRALRRGEASAGDRLLLAWTVAPMVLVSLPGGRNTHYAIYAIVPWSIWAALTLARFGDRLQARGRSPLRVRRAAIVGLTVVAAAYGLVFGLFGARFDRRGKEWAFYEQAGALVRRDEPLVLLYDDWDRDPYPTPFGPIPHDLAVRLYYLDRPASWHLAGDPTSTEADSPPASLAVVARDRDLPALAELGDVQILARGPDLRWDRVFSLYRVVPIRPAMNSASSTPVPRTMKTGS